ncbi:MAG: aminoacyl-tRNA hydrolase [Ruminococcaceae bacterium]|nr:aminoacyl-tRNA hydrolase [Oscillospiraceae bacterium]
MANIFDLFKKIERAAAPTTGAPAYLVVGLGNPGAEYARTRHNAGFLAVDALARSVGASIDRARFQALVGEGVLAGERVLFMKPQTYMNLSGDAVREAAAFYHVAPDHIIVIYDDVTLDVGRLRVRGKGSDGGHNGMKSIIARLGSNEFARVRIGVGKKPHPSYDLADWVLSVFSAEELEKLGGLGETVEKGVSLLLKGDLAAAMQTCNGVGGSC